MAILDKLMERKYLKHYLDLRIEEIDKILMDKVKEELQETPEKIPAAQIKLKYRKKELKRLRKHLDQHSIEEENKRLWRTLYDKGIVDYEDN